MSHIFIWNWSNELNVESVLMILMAWCFSTRASVATVLTTHPCVSRCLRVNRTANEGYSGPNNITDNTSLPPFIWSIIASLSPLNIAIGTEQLLCIPMIRFRRHECPVDHHYKAFIVTLFIWQTTVCVLCALFNYPYINLLDTTFVIVVNV